MLVVGLQFYTGDWYRAMKLADLLRTLATRRRDDVALLFVRTSQLRAGRFVDEMISRCGESFHVESVVLGPDTPARQARWRDLGRWPVGCNVLWQGMVEHFLRMDPRWTTLFAVDGGDSSPLCREWIDVLVEDHGRTIASGKQVTGWVGNDGLGRRHVNLSCLYERSFFEQHPEVAEMPSGADYHEPVDMLHREVILSACRASSVIRSSWRAVGVTGEEVFAQLAEKSAWWHGCKDGDLVDRAREHIVSRPPGSRPVVEDYGPASAMSAAGEVSP